MAPFLYRCPNTGQHVQGWSAEEVSPDQAGTRKTMLIAIQSASEIADEEFLKLADSLASIEFTCVSTVM